MSISANVAVSGGLYVPFRGFDREAGAVGTLDVQGATVGDGSGGTVAINIQWNYLEFGFHPIWIPTMISVQDTLAVAELVEVLFRGLGNERINDFHAENVTTTASVFTTRNLGKVTDLGFPIEPPENSKETLRTMLSAGWATNTNALLYELHAFGVIYDAEALARGKVRGRAPDLLLGGVR